MRTRASAAVLFAACLATPLAWPAGAGGQSIGDSITVEVYERPATVTVVGPSRVYKGDSLLYLARVLDANGAPTVAFLVWSVSDTARASIRPLSDSTALVVARKSGPLTVRARVGPLDSLSVGFIAPDGTVDMVGAGTWYLGPTGTEGQACAVLWSGGVMWGISPPACLAPWVAEYGNRAPYGAGDRLALYRGWSLERVGQSVFGLRNRIAALPRPAAFRMGVLFRGS